MGQCPNCGTPAEDWATVCENCGATLDGGQGGDAGGQGGGAGGQRGQSGGQGRGQNRQGRGQNGQNQQRQAQGQQRQAQGGRQQGYGHQKSRSAGGQGQGSAGGSGSGVSRRTLLAGGAGLVVLAGGGYLGYQEFLADEDDGAADGETESTAREFVNAVGDQDGETMQSLAHPESPQNFSTDDSSDETSITINGLSETEPISDEAATAIEADLSVESVSDDVTYLVEFRELDGEWLVWRAGPRNELAESGTGETGQQSDDQQSAPQATFDFDFDLTDDDNQAGFLTITFAAGENIEYETLSVVGDGFGVPARSGDYDFSDENTFDGPPPNNQWPETAANSDGYVAAGDSIIVAVETDYEVSVVWTAPNGGNSATLGESVGPDA